MADPVSERSSFLCTYMSSHPDTLVAYAKHFGKVKGNVSSAKMLSIDTKVRAQTTSTTTVVVVPSPTAARLFLFLPVRPSVRPSVPSQPLAVFSAIWRGAREDVDGWMGGRGRGRGCGWARARVFFVF
jgi:hypothetical protein